jgi:trans-aconitate 2-methyltransferase
MTNVTPTYKWDAHDYAQSSSSQQLWARELIEKMQLAGNERVLDIGCGDGKVTAEIAARLPLGHVVGVDSSAEMIALATSRFLTGSVSNLNFQQADASNLPFANEFTQIFSNAALHWVLDHQPVLRGIYSALKPGGKVLMQMGGKGNAAQVVTVMNRMIDSSEWREYFEDFSFPYGFYAPDEYAHWINQAGLQAERVELLPKDMLHADRTAFEGWVRTTWLPYTQRVPELKRQQFLEQFADAYALDFPPDAKGGIHVKMVRLQVQATKP